MNINTVSHQLGVCYPVDKLFKHLSFFHVSYNKEQVISLVSQILTNTFENEYYIQIYHVWKGYLRKIPVERRKISRAEWQGKYSLKTGILRKYPSQS